MIRRSHIPASKASCPKSEPAASQVSTAPQAHRDLFKVSQSRSRGGREVDDDNGDDDDVHRAHVVPQHPESTRQTARQADSTSGQVKRTVERRVGRRSQGSGEKDDGGDEDVRHVYIVPGPIPSPPDEASKPLLPSTPLEGEKSGEAERSSGRTREATTHDDDDPLLIPNHPEPPPVLHHPPPSPPLVPPPPRTTHDSGGETKAPPSVWLEGESKLDSSRHVEPTDVKMNDVDIEGTLLPIIPTHLGVTPVPTSVSFVSSISTHLGVTPVSIVLLIPIPTYPSLSFGHSHL
ncbi:hypothetical protein PAXINDRAFT_22299 [Paxillus involutus ATCC 200175]|uniref:Uncharacterized protein n=1 Tax=Paxillus involutus ATCC 200175 TaxID=664439 RepID=A0A0C9SZ84_PAXIN|nr:hypothetical protein PAXINDRAFT_22299 [Paxillus involutus ATCC 200175]